MCFFAYAPAKKCVAPGPATPRCPRLSHALVPGGEVPQEFPVQLLRREAREEPMRRALRGPRWVPRAVLERRGRHPDPRGRDQGLRMGTRRGAHQPPRATTQQGERGTSKTPTPITFGSARAARGRPRRNGRSSACRSRRSGSCPTSRSRSPHAAQPPAKKPT